MTQTKHDPKGTGALSADRAIDSHTLFAGRSEIIIRHETNEYRLRITGSGKLILTK
ncbi:MAG: hemin uptake protein HemP [Alphaproteobacteria bacterium]|nr:hemin uptake protein HemP [Alphaproteobacteria bacterium]